jgi:hypothetical protein
VFDLADYYYLLGEYNNYEYNYPTDWKYASDCAGNDRECELRDIYACVDNYGHQGTWTSSTNDTIVFDFEGGIPGYLFSCAYDCVFDFPMMHYKIGGVEQSYLNVTLYHFAWVSGDWSSVAVYFELWTGLNRMHEALESPDGIMY